MDAERLRPWIGIGLVRVAGVFESLFMLGIWIREGKELATRERYVVQRGGERDEQDWDAGHSAP